MCRIADISLLRALEFGVVSRFYKHFVDTSNLRLPYDRITANDGTVMEMHPRPVDLSVDKPVGESYLGRDSQLDAAVRELLKEIGARRQ